MGVSRIMMVTQYMEESRLLKLAERKPLVLGIVAHISKSETEKYGQRSRQFCLELKRDLEAMAKAVYPWRDVQIVMDLKTKPKLSDKLNLLMNNHNEYLRPQIRKVIVVGAKEIEERCLTVKISKSNQQSQDITFGLNELQ